MFIAVALELAGIPSLAFAVGVYLPLSASAPVLVGGVVRYLVDRRLRRVAGSAAYSEAELAAESDKSPGVLLASGYIAGGAIAGILIAFMAGVFDRIDASLMTWASRHNPLYAGPLSDALALVPFSLLVGLLLLVAFSHAVGRPGWRGSVR